MIAGYVAVVYDGKGQPGGIDKVLRLKAHPFPSGERVEVPAELAGLLLKTAPKGTVKVLEGTPADVVILPAAQKSAAKAAAKAAAEHAARFPVAPDEALASIDALPAEILKALSGKDEEAVAFIDAGKADKALAHVALWAKLGRKTGIANAAVKRSGEITKAAAKA